MTFKPKNPSANAKFWARIVCGCCLLDTGYESRICVLEDPEESLREQGREDEIHRIEQSGVVSDGTSDMDSSGVWR